MLISGLDWPVILPFISALVGLLVGWRVFLRRDLRNPGRRCRMPATSPGPAGSGLPFEAARKGL